MVDLESVIRNMPGDRIKLLSALKILADSKLFSAIARANKNQLVDERMDSEDDTALAKEIREVRQANRVLLGLEESATQLTKDMTDA